MTSHIPVIVGVGEVSNEATGTDDLWPPRQLMVLAARAAIEDCSSIKSDVTAALDHVTAIRLFADFSKNFGSDFGTPTNVPWSVASALGVQAKSFEYAQSGGDTPQIAVAEAAARIASGAIRSALIVGAEAFRTDRRAARADIKLDWREPGPALPPGMSADKFYSEDELAHGLNTPVSIYALIDQAVRAKQSAGAAARNQSIGTRLAHMAQVAKDNPFAAHRDGYSADDIVTPADDNRIISLPYTRRMIAEPSVDLGAAILLMSEECADEFRIPHEKRVYLRGHAQAVDEWYLSDRDDLAQSPAIRLSSRHAAAQAGVDIGSIAAFDIYSCFPSAVDIAASELGIAEDDPRPLTVTGGLPFFGGPGNNYVTHAIARMVRYVREHPSLFGMVTANGGGLTKHAVGVYSSVRPDGPLPSFDAEAIQAEVQQAWGDKADLSKQGQGPADIETYTILYGKTGPAKGIVFARGAESGRRCIAVLSASPEELERLAGQDLIGMRGMLTHSEGINRFRPDCL
ncbi:MAG TPA: hypothetical protein VNQ99_03355 [Xanthobacteraceae bacterium]|nr:hypothetical protein [Xanthobacteraceae bacterium]